MQYEDSVRTLRGMRGMLNIDSSRVRTPQALNALIDDVSTALDRCRVEVDEPKPKKSEVKPAPDKSENRQETGGHTRGDG